MVGEIKKTILVHPGQDILQSNIYVFNETDFSLSILNFSGFVGSDGYNSRNISLICSINDPNYIHTTSISLLSG